MIHSVFAAPLVGPGSLRDRPGLGRHDGTFGLWKGVLDERGAVGWLVEVPNRARNTLSSVEAGVNPLTVTKCPSKETNCKVYRAHPWQVSLFGIV